MDPRVLYSLIGAGAIVFLVCLLVFLGKPMGGQRSGDADPGPGPGVE
jgi:hypothetical protein